MPSSFGHDVGICCDVVVIWLLLVSGKTDDDMPEE